ncbi:MAG: CDP-alcohol phosphatidyltransferase family protein [Neomegalonema sp.]
MFDARLRPLIDPPLNWAGARLARMGVMADTVTWLGFVFGMSGCVLIAVESYGWALALILLGRAADGLDGAVARATVKTDRGGFLDIVLDFIFYGSVPFAFAIADPDANAVAAAALLLSYYANGSSFLAFAVMAAKSGVETTAQGEKSLFYLAGVAEGFETILFTALFCLFPNAFAPLAFVFAGLVAVSAGARVAVAMRQLR